ncbi:hypothetical protein BDV96DRAFT_318987 [Lophiotrema nucula]|uniref:Uncharacterized protein n=1 Tax=Lophiotrema nucula TaxID=690887 RepID=A0A6A5ZL86_9PLEO|nr:hypothetical protein BDV96DRAFT_318987 [Lophiotrema nucula]
MGCCHLSPRSRHRQLQSTSRFCWVGSSVTLISADSRGRCNAFISTMTRLDRFRYPSATSSLGIPRTSSCSHEDLVLFLSTYLRKLLIRYRLFDPHSIFLRFDASSKGVYCHRFSSWHQVGDIRKVPYACQTRRKPRYGVLFYLDDQIITKFAAEMTMTCVIEGKIASWP